MATRLASKARVMPLVASLRLSEGVSSAPGGRRARIRRSATALARAFGFLGKRCNGVILATLMNGSAGFADLKRAVSGISDSVLSERLSELAGLLRGVEIRRHEDRRVEHACAVRLIGRPQYSLGVSVGHVLLDRLELGHQPEQRLRARLPVIGRLCALLIANVDPVPGAGEGMEAERKDDEVDVIGMVARLDPGRGDPLDRILAHPRGMVCSDGGGYAVSGPTRSGHPHPRGLGSFPRVLGRYVRERRALTLPQAINKMTALPASRLRITDRGRLAPGLAGDVVVFDPATVIDRATYAEPFQYPTGIKAVLVNGAVALLDDARDAKPAGRSVRPSA